MSNPAGEERENIPLPRAVRGPQGPRRGRSDPALLPGAEDGPDPLCRSRDAFYCVGSGRVGLEELLGAGPGVPAGLGGLAAMWGSVGGGRGDAVGCVAIPTLLNLCRRTSLAPGSGQRRAQIFVSPFTLGPGAGGGWRGEMQPRARRDACPRGEYPRDYHSPWWLLPGGTGACGWPGRLCPQPSFLTWYNRVTISSVTTCSVRAWHKSCSIIRRQRWGGGSSAAGWSQAGGVWAEAARLSLLLLWLMIYLQQHPPCLVT